MASSLGKIHKNEFFRGLVMAALGGVASVPVSEFQGNGLPSLQTVGTFAAVGLLTYIVKNLGTNSQGVAFGIKATAPKPPITPA